MVGRGPSTLADVDKVHAFADRFLAPASASTSSSAASHTKPAPADRLTSRPNSSVTTRGSTRFWPATPPGARVVAVNTATTSGHLQPGEDRQSAVRRSPRHPRERDRAAFAEVSRAI